MSFVSGFLSWRKWPARIALFLLGALAVLGQAPFHIWPVSLICFAVFFAAIIHLKNTDNSAFWMSLWFALGYFLAGTHWVGEAFIARGPEFIPAMPPMVLGLALLLAVFWAIAGWAYQGWAANGARGEFALIGFFTLAELARGHVFGGLPWNLPGYIFPAGSPISQIASLIGAYGLTFLTIAAAIMIAQRFLDLKNIRALVTFLLGFIAVFGFGIWRLDNAEITHHENVKLRLIQFPFDQADQMEPDTSIQIARQFIRLSLAPGLDDITHLVWPEGAVPGLTLENEGLMIAMGDMLSTSTQTPPIWLLNSLRHEEELSDDGELIDHYYNTSAALSVDPLGQIKIEAYNDKYRLVPFGEIIPGGRFVENLGAKTLSTALASITPAPQKELARFPGLPMVSPQICYEVVFPGLTPAGTDSEQAEWIFNQSNDAWFGGSIGPYQHANITAYRAIETGLPIIRSASNGVSGVIDPYGRYAAKLDPDEEGVLDVALPNAISRPWAFSGLALWVALINIALVLQGLNRFVNRNEPQT